MATESNKTAATRRRTTRSSSKPGAKPATRAKARAKSKPKATMSAGQTTETKAQAKAAKPRPTVAAQQAKRDRAGADRVAAGLTATDQVLAQLAITGQSAIGAVRHFLDQVDSALLPEQERSSGAHDVIDSALEMSGVLVANGSETIRGIVRSTGEAIS